MAITVFIPAKYAENAQTTQYVADSTTRVKATIDKFTATNNSANNVTFSVNMVPASGAASTENRVIAARVIAPNECYTCPELVGHTLEPGGFISTIASASSAITIRASGRTST